MYMRKDDYVNSSHGHREKGQVWAEQSDLPLGRAIYQEWKEAAICILLQTFIRDSCHISLILHQPILSPYNVQNLNIHHRSWNLKAPDGREPTPW